MNWDRIEGNWKQLSGKVKEQWASLTNDDLAAIDGRREQLAGKIQERYGVSRDAAEQQIDDYLTPMLERELFRLTPGGAAGRRLLRPQRPHPQRLLHTARLLLGAVAPAPEEVGARRTDDRAARVLRQHQALQRPRRWRSRRPRLGFGAVDP